MPCHDAAMLSPAIFRFVITLPLLLMLIFYYAIDRYAAFRHAAMLRYAICRRLPFFEVAAMMPRRYAAMMLLRFHANRACYATRAYYAMLLMLHTPPHCLLRCRHAIFSPPFRHADCC